MKNTMHVGDNAPHIEAKDVWDRSVKVLRRGNGSTYHFIVLLTVRFVTSGQMI